MPPLPSSYCFQPMFDGGEQRKQQEQQQQQQDLPHLNSMSTQQLSWCAPTLSVHCLLVSHPAST